MERERGESETKHWAASGGGGTRPAAAWPPPSPGMAVRGAGGHSLPVPGSQMPNPRPGMVA